MINVNKISELKREFEEIQIEFNALHDEMQAYLDGYKHNFFYRPKPNVTAKTNIGVNLVQVFADKLWFHTSEFPKINVPSDPEDKQNADAREKIVLATHQQNGTDLLWGDWTFDGSIMAGAVARTVFNVKTRKVEISRHDPRRCYWQKSGSGTNEVTVFWTATPMTREAIKMKYGVTPKDGEGMVYDLVADDEFIPIDGKDYFLVVTRDDHEHSTVFVGSQYLTKPYKHLQGIVPVDVALPYRIASFNNAPRFYLSKLKDLQAEFNEYWRRRGNIVRKLGNPLAYGRGVYKNNEQEIKKQMAGDGGFVALKENGELALLTIPETKMIDTSLTDCFNRMKDVAGFPTATFGEVLGANTSGDALGMYFTPTQKMINHYNKAYKAFLQGINSKILCSYDKFLKIDEEITLDGYINQSGYKSVGGNSRYVKGDGYSVKFTKDVIAKKYLTVVTPAAVTPKDDIAYKRFILDSVTNKFMSRTTGLDEIGILSPEDEFKQLQQEQSDPMLNPEGATAVQGFDPTAQLQNEQGQNPFDPLAAEQQQPPFDPTQQQLPTPEELLQRG